MLERENAVLKSVEVDTHKEKGHTKGEDVMFGRNRNTIRSGQKDKCGCIYNIYINRQWKKLKKIKKKHKRNKYKSLLHVRRTWTLVTTCCETYICSRQQPRCQEEGCTLPWRLDQTPWTSFAETFAWNQIIKLKLKKKQRKNPTVIRTSKKADTIRKKLSNVIQNISSIIIGYVQFI